MSETTTNTITPRRITVMGLGLIGGSMALDWRSAGHHLIGVDNNEIHCEKALDYQLVDEIATLENAVKNCDVLLISIPVDHIEQLLPSILDQISWKTVVIDAGSTKGGICKAVEGHKKRARFVAAHPLAGTEFSGPSAALKGLFQNKKNLICQEDLVDEDALEIALELFDELGMQNLFMDANEHDKHMAYVSHLSHVSSFMLGKTVLDIEKDQKQIQNLAGTGFASTVRLAKSSPETWAAIFQKNKNELSTALESYIDHLQDFKTALDNDDRPKVLQMMTEANDIKRVLTGIKRNAVKLS